MFFCVLLYIFMLFLSLKFPCNFFLYHLGSDLRALEIGRFFPIPVSLVLGSLSLHYPLWCWWLLSPFSNMHSDMVWLIVHSHVTWLWAEQTVPSLHDWCLLCSIKDFCFQLSPLLVALLLKGVMNIHCFDAFQHVFFMSSMQQDGTISKSLALYNMNIYLYCCTSSCPEVLVQGR